MIRTLTTAVAAITLLAGVSAGITAPCKDVKGKFTRCPPAATAAAGKPAASNVTKDAKGRCHIASGPKKGQFTKY